MPKYSIWGRNPWGEAKCYALYVDQDMIEEYKREAEEYGWSELVSGVKAQPELFPDEQSASSDEADPSPKKKRASSGTSVDASHD